MPPCIFTHHTLISLTFTYCSAHENVIHAHPNVDYQKPISQYTDENKE